MQPVPTLPAVDYGQRSDPGRDPLKQINEDVCGRSETRFGHLCVVCDGMGGHAAGREAAELALSTIVEMFDHAADGSAPAEVLRTAIEEANRRVHVLRTSEIGLGRPGCTVVATLTHGFGTEVAHVGDSRAYLVHEGEIFRLTRDHSIVQDLVDRGLLMPNQAIHHPDANRITRALGIGPDADVELRTEPVHHVAGDTFVLCSDGLSDLVDDAEILGVVANEPAAQAVGRLVDLANARGGHDNVTVLVLRTRETAGPAPAGVLPTIADTTTTLPLAVAPTAPQPPTLVPTIPSDRAPHSPRVRPVVIAALVLASIAIVLLGGVLTFHMAERKGQRNPAIGPATGLGAGDTEAEVPAALSPDHVVIPASPVGEPIAPLEPTPSERKKRKRD